MHSPPPCFACLHVAVYVIVVVVIADAAMNQFAGFNPITKNFIVNLGFAFCSFSTISIYFGSKAYLLWEGAEFDANMGIVHRKSKSIFKYATKSENSLSELNSNVKLTSVRQALEALQKGSYSSSRKLCLEQIAMALYRLEEDANHHMREWEEALTALRHNRLDAILDSPVAYFNRYKGNQSTTTVT